MNQDPQGKKSQFESGKQQMEKNNGWLLYKSSSLLEKCRKILAELGYIYMAQNESEAVNLILSLIKYSLYFEYTDQSKIDELVYEYLNYFGAYLYNMSLFSKNYDIVTGNNEFNRLIQALDNHRFNLVRPENDMFEQLGGILTDWNDKDRARSMIIALVPSVEAFINASQKTATGYSPNMLDKGRELKMIPDVKLDDILGKIKDNLRNETLSLRGAADYLRQLQAKLVLAKNLRDQRELSYIVRYKDYYDGVKNKKDLSFAEDEMVAYFIGNVSNKHTLKWQSRFKLMKFVKMVGKKTALIVDLDGLNPITVAVAMLKKYINGNDWMSELDYEKFVRNRDENNKKKEKTVSFSMNLLLIQNGNDLSEFLCNNSNIFL